MAATRDPSGSAATSGPSDQPGRWLGGAAGAISCLVVALFIRLAEGSFQVAAPWISTLSWAWIAMLGTPVAFVIGRAAYPSIRAGGWAQAIGVGLLLGFVAPPLGGLEIVLGPFLVPQDLRASGGLGLILALPLVAAFSYVVVWVTVPVGVLTGLLVRAIPDRWAANLRARRPIDRLRVRHVLFALATWAVAVQIVSALARR